MPENTKDQDKTCGTCAKYKELSKIIGECGPSKQYNSDPGRMGGATVTHPDTICIHPTEYEPRKPKCTDSEAQAVRDEIMAGEGGYRDSFKSPFA